MEPEEQKPTRMLVKAATFMGLDAAEMTASPDQKLIVLSLEREEGVVETVAFTHHDAKAMLGALLEALKSQGSPTAAMLLDVIEQAHGKENHDEDEEEPGGETQEEDDNDDSDDDQSDALNDPTGGYGLDA